MTIIHKWTVLALVALLTESVVMSDGSTEQRVLFWGNRDGKRGHLLMIRKQGRRRGLELVSDNDNENEEALFPAPPNLENCGNDTLYNVFMHTDDHVGLVAIPIDDDLDVCPALYFHESVVDGKVVEEVESMDEGSETLMFLSSSPLKNIMEAFHVSSSHDIVDDGYDIVANNCASFFLDMVVELGMDVTQAIADHAAKNLGQSGGTLSMLVEHPDFETIFPEGPTMAEENPDLLLQIFVEHYIKTHVDADNIAF